MPVRTYCKDHHRRHLPVSAPGRLRPTRGPIQEVPAMGSAPPVDPGEQPRKEALVRAGT